MEDQRLSQDSLSSNQDQEDIEIQEAS